MRWKTRAGRGREGREKSHTCFSDSSALTWARSASTWALVGRRARLVGRSTIEVFGVVEVARFIRGVSGKNKNGASSRRILWPLHPGHSGSLLTDALAARVLAEAWCFCCDNVSWRCDLAIPPLSRLSSNSTAMSSVRPVFPYLAQCDQIWYFKLRISECASRGAEPTSLAFEMPPRIV